MGTHRPPTFSQGLTWWRETRAPTDISWLTPTGAGRRPRMTWWSWHSRLRRQISSPELQLAANFRSLLNRSDSYKIKPERAWKKPDEEFLSMISPEEWGASGPEFVGGYRLEFDMSWTELKDCEKKSNETALINKILDTNTSDLKFSFLPSQY